VNTTEALARFVSELRYDDIPESTRRFVALSLVDAVASAYAGRYSGPELEQVVGVSQRLAGDGEATVIGTSRTMAPAGAALVNGYQVTAASVCDVYAPGHCHITPEVVPPALAVAEAEHSSGRAMITALAAGLEITTRISLGLNYEAFHGRGWHGPGVVGPFGGAAAVGSLLGLDPMAQRNALSLAGSQSAGTLAHWGTPTIKFHQSRAAFSGLLAGMLAAEGYVAGPDVLAGERGSILELYTVGGSAEAMTDRLGERWELEQISLKRWPAGSSLQTLVACLTSLVDGHDVDVSSVEEVAVALPSASYDRHATMPWDSSLRSQLSARFVASVVLHDRSCWLEQFEDARRLDPDVDTFARSRVKVVEMPSLPSSGCEIEIGLKNGERLRIRRDVAKGDPTDPFTLEDVIAKFREASWPYLPSDDVDHVVDRLVNVGECPDVAPVICLLGQDRPES